MKRAIAAAVLLALGIGAAIWWYGRPSGNNPSPPAAVDPPVMFSVPRFQLTTQTGEAYGSDQLLGRVWVANFIFTRCQATCPAQTAHLTKVQREWSGEPFWDQVRLVSITVDPEHDTSAVLQEYAAAAAAEAAHWKFLTGPREAIWELSKFGFKLPVADESRDSQTLIAHSPKFALVDQQGDVRGFYESGSEEELAALERDLRRVADERVLAPIDEILDPPWLPKRQQAQLQAADSYRPFHDFRFRDQLLESGITFRNRIVDDSGRNWQPAHYDHGNGVAVADVDGDGRLDVYFVTQVGPNQLWKNQGGGKFKEITAQAGVALADRIGVSASFADVDNDGDADLYVTSVRGGNALLENDGSGTFRDITREAGLDYSGHSSAAVFFDYNNDGRLDLLLVNVGKYTTDDLVHVRADRVTGPEVAQYQFYSANPDAFAAHLKPARAEASLLYENQGDGKFADVSQQTGFREAGWTGAASPLDANGDGWTDLYVTNMQGHDQYYENYRGEKFINKTRQYFPATPWGSMGIKVFDFDNDGKLDIYLTDMHTDMATELDPANEKAKIDPGEFELSLLKTDGNHVWGNALFRNRGEMFQEVSESTNAENYWPWGLSTGDLNADGYEDVLITACMNYPFRYAINSLLLNDRGEKFLDSEFVVGIEPRRGGRTAIPWFELEPRGKDREHPLSKQALERGVASDRLVVWGALGSRSSAIFDLDNDGDLDIITNDFNSPPMVLISDLTERHAEMSYLQLSLVGKTSNRNGLGARVALTVGEQTFTKVHDGQSGYLSQSLIPLYFGLDGAQQVDRIEVRWPSGKTQRVEGPLDVKQTLTITEE